MKENTKSGQKELLDTLGDTSSVPLRPLRRLSKTAFLWEDPDQNLWPLINLILVHLLWTRISWVLLMHRHSSDKGPDLSLPEGAYLRIHFQARFGILCEQVSPVLNCESMPRIQFNTKNRLLSLLHFLSRSKKKGHANLPLASAFFIYYVRYRNNIRLF